MMHNTILSITAFLLEAAGLVLTLQFLLTGDMWVIAYLVIFLFDLGETLWLWTAARKGKSLPQQAGFLDLLFFIIGLGMSLFYSRFRWLGLLVILGFPLRQMLRRRDEAKEDEEEKSDRFQQHIRR